MSPLELPLLRIERHESDVPWLKVFVRRSVKEFSSCSDDEKAAVWRALEIIEKSMLAYYRPEKINLASFGNMLPQVHWHIMARFQEDPFFPEPMWGTPQRESSLELPPFEPFWLSVSTQLKACFPFTETQKL